MYQEYDIIVLSTNLSGLFMARLMSIYSKNRIAIISCQESDKEYTADDIKYPFGINRCMLDYRNFLINKIFDTQDAKDTILDKSQTIKDLFYVGNLIIRLTGDFEEDIKQLKIHFPSEASSLTRFALDVLNTYNEMTNILSISNTDGILNYIETLVCRVTHNLAFKEITEYIDEHFKSEILKEILLRHCVDSNSGSKTAFGFYAINIIDSSFGYASCNGIKMSGSNGINGTIKQLLHSQRVSIYENVIIEKVICSDNLVKKVICKDIKCNKTLEIYGKIFISAVGALKTYKELAKITPNIKIDTEMSSINQAIYIATAEVTHKEKLSDKRIIFSLSQKLDLYNHNINTKRAFIKEQQTQDKAEEITRCGQRLYYGFSIKYIILTQTEKGIKIVIYTKESIIIEPVMVELCNEIARYINLTMKDIGIKVKNINLIKHDEISSDMPLNFEQDGNIKKKKITKSILERVKKLTTNIASSIIVKKINIASNIAIFLIKRSIINGEFERDIIYKNILTARNILTNGKQKKIKYTEREYIEATEKHNFELQNNKNNECKYNLASISNCFATIPRRIISTFSRIKSPIENLYLCGEDVESNGIAGAIMGDFYCAIMIMSKEESRRALDNLLTIKKAYNTTR